MTVATPVPQPILSDELLRRCAERAPTYDRENRFCAEDFEELRQAGYLRIAIPEELGGRGKTLAEVAEQQRRLAYYAPATALAVNMHIYWTGLAADLWRAGDRSLEWLLREAADGEVFAAGHAESGNDVPVLLSTTEATPVDGGYRITGRKSFGSLSPVWTRLGVHALDRSDPQNPRVVHAFIPRDAEGLSIETVWDAMGMRATGSEDTLLDGVLVPEDRIARVVPAGFAGLDPFVLGVFAWALLGFAAIYLGLAERALDVTLERVKKKTSLAMSRPMAYHAGVQQSVAEMVLELEAMVPHLEAVTRDWSTGVDHGARWGLKLVACKHRVVEGAWRTVDRALDVAGGFGVFRASGIERMVRDARLGRIHPANPYLTHEIVAKTALGISPDETPRWG